MNSVVVSQLPVCQLLLDFIAKLFAVPACSVRSFPVLAWVHHNRIVVQRQRGEVRRALEEGSDFVPLEFFEKPNF